MRTCGSAQALGLRRCPSEASEARASLLATSRGASTRCSCGRGWVHCRLRLTGQVGRRLVSVASGPRFDSRMNVGFSFERKKFGSPVWRTHRGEQRFALAQTLPYHFVAARRDRAAQISLDGLHNAVVRPGVCHPSPEPRPLPRYGRAGLLLVTTSLRRSVLAGPSPHNLPQGWYWWRSGYPSLARHRWCEALPALPLGVCECEWNVSASLLRIHKQPPLPVSLPPGQSSVKKNTL